MEKKPSYFPIRILLPLRKLNLIMKLSLLLLLAALQVSAKNFGQKTINIKADNVSPQEVFKRIEQQTNYRFYYSSKDFSTIKPLAVSVEKASLNQVLKAVFDATDIKWKVINDTKVVLYKNKDQLLEQLAITVKGRVNNDAGKPIEGASILVKGGTIGTTTDSKGEFSINTTVGSILLVSAIGYIEKEITVGDENITIVLNTTATKMDEVVVVAYGTQKRVNISGAVNTINTGQITSRPVTSLTNSLQGLIPGMVVLARPGDVGSDIGSINVRDAETWVHRDPFLLWMAYR